MECMICLNIKEPFELFKCGNNGCEKVICVGCYLKWIRYNNVDISDHCVFCNKPIDYVTIKLVMNKNNKIKEYVKVKKNQIYSNIKFNITTINCDNELFNEFINIKKNDIKMICFRNEDIDCNLSYDDYYLIANMVDKKHKYYGSYGELMNEFNNANNVVINNINKLVYEVRNGISDKLNDNINDVKNKIISNKKLLLKQSFEILSNGLLITSDIVHINNECNKFICPVDNCFGFVKGGKCECCKINICDKCRIPIYLHKPYYDVINDINNESNNQSTKLELAKLLNDYPLINKISNDIINDINVARRNNKLPNIELNTYYNCYLVMCDDNNYKTCQMIIKDSKQCPKCKNYIQRIYGCNQMFCTICHTCFNWVTLEILDKVNVNNPELIEYQRLNNLDSLVTLSSVSCDVINYEFDNLVNKLLVNGKFDKVTEKKIIKLTDYYDKFIEIKHYLNNDYYNQFNNQQQLLLKHYKIKYIKIIFDSDYCNNKFIINNYRNKILNKLKNRLFDIYDNIYCLFKIQGYYQTLAQGINDILLKIQKIIIEWDKNCLDNKYLFNEIRFNELMDELINWCSYMTGIINESIKILKPNIDLINLKLFNAK